MKPNMKSKLLSRFSKEEDGAMTLLGLYIFLGVAIVGAIGIDVGNLYSSRTHLQVLTDQVGHAAIYQRENNSEAQAVTNALALVEDSAPAAKYGEPIRAADIVFGTFDNDTSTFTADSGSKEAVYVKASFTADRGNAASSFLFKLVGTDSFDIVTESVWQAYYPACLNEGLVAVGKVDVRSNNGFGEGFCLHSNYRFEMQNHNDFDNNATVSMPDKSDLISGGFDSNPGLEDALKDGFVNLRVLDRLDTFKTGLLTGDADIIPDYITDFTPISITGNRFDGPDFLPGRIYEVSCPGTRIDIDSNAAPLQGVVIVTDCKVRFSGGSHMQDAVVFSTNHTNNSISSPASLTVGLNDSCAPGGGAKLVTYGGMSFPADLKAYGGTFIAKTNIEFAANANGMEGVSMIAGGIISGTSNMTQGACPADMDNSFQVPYYRMAG